MASANYEIGTSAATLGCEKAWQKTANDWSKIRVGSATVTVNRADLEAALALIQSMLNQ